MKDDQTVTLQDVFKYVEEVRRQSQLIILDTVEALGEKTDCPFHHESSWGFWYVPKGNFLETRQFGISRAWVTYVPQGKLSLAALFYIQYYHEKYPVVPAFTYGSLNPGDDRTFSEIDSRAPRYTILGIETVMADFSVEQDGPFSIVKCKKDGYFPEARLVRVPLISIASRRDLDIIVVEPLVALVKGEVEKARELLRGVETITWPVSPVSIEALGEEEEPEMP